MEWRAASCREVARQAHFFRIANRLERLFFERRGPSVPEERSSPREVVEMRSVPLHRRASDAHREAFPVAEAAIGLMARGTCDGIGRGKARVEEELASELDDGAARRTSTRVRNVWRR